jgi:hypothetical protein
MIKTLLIIDFFNIPFVFLVGKIFSSGLFIFLFYFYDKNKFNFFFYNFYSILNLDVFKYKFMNKVLNVFKIFYLFSVLIPGLLISIPSLTYFYYLLSFFYWPLLLFSISHSNFLLNYFLLLYGSTMLTSVGQMSYFLTVKNKKIINLNRKKIMINLLFLSHKKKNLSKTIVKSFFSKPIHFYFSLFLLINLGGFIHVCLVSLDATLVAGCMNSLEYSYTYENYLDQFKLNYDLCIEKSILKKQGLFYFVTKFYVLIRKIFSF